jgi:hypothetical protein
MQSRLFQLLLIAATLCPSVVLANPVADDTQKPANAAEISEGLGCPKGTCLNEFLECVPCK